MKSHFEVRGKSACGRGKVITDRPRQVTCLLCADTFPFKDAKRQADAEAEAAFQAQEPVTVVPQFGRVNDEGVMECPWCFGDLWRERPRSLFSYHYVCANEECGKSVFPLTETGMST